MIQTGLIQSAHADLVTDAAYDFYGLRLATCSLDQRLAESRRTISFPYPFFAESKYGSSTSRTGHGLLRMTGKYVLPLLSYSKIYAFRRMMPRYQK